jgi:hypothetical protein
LPGGGEEVIRVRLVLVLLQAGLAEREQQQIALQTGYRTRPGTLRKLAASLSYTLPQISAKPS